VFAARQNVRMSSSPTVPTSATLARVYPTLHLWGFDDALAPVAAKDLARNRSLHAQRNRGAPIGTANDASAPASWSCVNRLKTGGVGSFSGGMAGSRRNPAVRKQFIQAWRMPNNITVHRSINHLCASPQYIVGMMAQWEREEVAERVKASVWVRATLGQPISGKSPSPGS
jgi:hypothetical protein